MYMTPVFSVLDTGNIPALLRRKTPKFQALNGTFSPVQSLGNRLAKLLL